jgi:hypothetical protein
VLRGTNSEAAYFAVVFVLLSPPSVCYRKGKVYLSTLNKLQLLLSTYSKRKGHQVFNDSHLALSNATVERFKIHHSFAVVLIILSANEASGMPFILWKFASHLLTTESKFRDGCMSYIVFPPLYDMLEFLEIAA